MLRELAEAAVMTLSGMLGCGCVRSRRGELRRIVNASRAHIAVLRLVCVVVLGDVRLSVSRGREHEVSVDLENMSNDHTF